MGKSILIILVILLLATGLGSVTYMLFSSTVIIPRIDNTTKNMNDFPGTSQLRIGRVYYHSSGLATNSSPCNTTDRKQIMIIEAIFSTFRMPDSCEVLVDNRYEKTVPLHDIPCDEECKSQEMKLAIDISEKNIYEQHKIKLCCEGICMTKTMPAIC